MGNLGEWITFAELCRRVPGLSPRTLRRLYKDRVISFRQLTRKGKVQFNWATVQRDLAVHESRGQGGLVELPPTAGELAELSAKVDHLAAVLTAVAQKLDIEIPRHG